jgi:hypothetical protein
MPMTLPGRAAVAAALALLTAVLPGAAHAWERPAQKGLVAPATIEGVDAKRPVRDVVRTVSPGARTSSHTPSRVEGYRDPHGHSIRLGTSEPGADLRSIAEILAGTVHRGELNRLEVLVMRLSQVPGECGGPPGTIGCYLSLASSRAGLMVVGYDDSDLVHTIVHEYGHHMDKQLVNLSHITTCGRGEDGSRRWVFAREARDRVFANTGCAGYAPYERLLGELYAEDYSVLAGIRDWPLDLFRPPSVGMTSALRRDIFEPFARSTRRFRGRLGRRGARKTRTFELDVHAYLTARLVGPSRRRANFDLGLYRSGFRKAIKRGTTADSSERIRKLLAPGTYKVRVRSRRGKGRYRLRLSLD